MKVLIVDDDAVDREFIVRLLKRAKLADNITETNSVDEGLAIAKQSPPDIILLDYRMPQRDGIEMLISMRSDVYGQIAIVMISSSSDNKLALDCIKAGAQDFLVKSEITEHRLKSAIIHAQTRFELESKLNQSYQKTKQLAERDSLTGLANRYAFDETLKAAIANIKRNQNKLALIFIDLDHFKFINDSYGHDNGDFFLISVVKKMQSVLRNNEILARIGGDEFAIVLDNIEKADYASAVTQRIHKVLEQEIKIGSELTKASASIGIAIAPDNTMESVELLKFADIAMYRAKKMGRNQTCFFEDKMQQKFFHNYRIGAELNKALINQEFVLFFQPVISLDNGEVNGFEALIRWEHQGKLRFPDEFIPVAEKSNQIKEIGIWVFRKAVQKIKQFNKNFDKTFTIAVNLSAVQLESPTLITQLTSIVNEEGIMPQQIELELTETVLMADIAVISEYLITLADFGFRIVLDDFGKGFSSISHLQNFPIHTVKIDRSLMPTDPGNSDSTKLLKGLVKMIEILGLDITAEGIENETHLKLCKKLRIHKAQGYYFSKPAPSEQIELALKSKQLSLSHAVSYS